MTIRERMLAVYRNEMPDQLPVTIYERYLRRGRFERSCRELGLGLIDFVPPVSLIAPPWHVADGFVSPVKGAHFAIKYDWEAGSPATAHVYETPGGSASRCTTVHAETHSDWVMKHYIQADTDYDALQYIVENTVLINRYAEFQDRVQHMGDDGVVFARIDRSGYQKLIIELANPQQLMVDLYMNPEKPQRLIETLNRRLEEQFNRVLESPAEVIWQPENMSADMTPPDIFEKYCLPLYRKFAQRAREAGKVYIVHMDGRLDALKHLIAQAPISVIESYSLPEMANDLAINEARTLWKDTVIVPNFPGALCAHDEASIAQRLDALIAEVGADTPFIMGVSENLPEDAYPHVLPILGRYFSKKRR